MPSAAPHCASCHPSSPALIPVSGCDRIRSLSDVEKDLSDMLRKVLAFHGAAAVQSCAGLARAGDRERAGNPSCWHGVAICHFMPQICRRDLAAPGCYDAPSPGRPLTLLGTLEVRTCLLPHLMLFVNWNKESCTQQPAPRPAPCSCSPAGSLPPRRSATASISSITSAVRSWNC
jgi:hypothetical protein